MAFTLRIGSRPSALAVAQAQSVKYRLETSLGGLTAEIVPIRTSGDKITSAPLANIGGKGLFIRELEQALADGRIDVAVHSMKDLPAVLDSQFRIACVPERENPRDALITNSGRGWESLPRGARLGTSSPRRRLQAMRLRDDLAVEMLRGNVDTRLRRLEAGDFDAIILAVAGLSRLGRLGIQMVELGEDSFIPAGGQGALAIEARSGAKIGASEEIESALRLMNSRTALAETSAERAFLSAIGASCVSPVGVKGSAAAGSLKVSAILFSEDGERSLEGNMAARLPPDAEDLDALVRVAASCGKRLGDDFLQRGAAEMIRHD